MMIKGCFLFSYVVLTLAVSCGRGVTPQTSSPTVLQVRPASTDCTISSDPAKLYTDSHQGQNTILWCVDPAVTTQYYIHFTNNSGNTSPVMSSGNEINDIPLNNPHASGNLTCSDLLTGNPNKPHNDRPYKYEVHIGASGVMTATTCADPKVILK